MIYNENIITEYESMELWCRDDWKKDKPKDKWKSDCPFCDIEKHKDILIWEWKYLKIIHNRFPMLGRKDHFMIIPKRHVILTSELSDNELIEMREAEKQMEIMYDGKRYFSFIRQAVANRSLEHLHYHYLPGNLPYRSTEDILRKQWY